MTGDQDAKWYGTDGKKSKKPHVRVVQPDEVDATRPPILVSPGRLDLAVEDSIAALARNPELHLYVRKGEGDLVRIAEAPKLRPHERPIFSEGTPRLYDVTTAGLAARLCQIAQFKERCRSGKIADCNPPSLVCAAILDKGACVGRLDTLTGIIETPTMRPDGSILRTPGYDPDTGYYLSLSGAWPEIPEMPTHEDAKKARETMEDIFIDFPWEHASGRSVALAALLSIVARPAIVGPVPAFIFDANEPGFGKSLAAETICHIATGRSGAPVVFPSNPDRSDEEVEKILAGAAMGGARIVWWDDLPFKNPLGGSALQRILTTRDTSQFRLLGQNRQLLLPWFAVTLATGNNVQTTHDMERRSYRARIVSKWENSAARPAGIEGGWSHPERKGRLIEHALEHRAELVTAALVLLRAYHVAGRPPAGTEHEGFEAFSRLVAGAIAWSGGESILRQRVSTGGQKSAERHALETVCAYWLALSAAMAVPQGDGIQLGKVIGFLYPKEGNGRFVQRLPDAFDSLREALETLDPKYRQGAEPNKQAVGLAFKKREKAVFVVDEYDGTPQGQKGVSRCLLSEASTRGGVAWHVVDPLAPPASWQQ